MIDVFIKQAVKSNPLPHCKLKLAEEWRNQMIKDQSQRQDPGSDH